MNFKFIDTRHSVLKKYMEGFYIFETEPHHALEYIVFPSNHTIISVYRQTRLQFNSREIHLTAHAKNPPVAIISLALQNPVIASYKNKTREIAFCFYPLGINHFVTKNLNSLYTENIQLFNWFPDFNAFISEIINEGNSTALQNKIEAYWLAKLQAKDFSLIQKMVQQLTETDTHVSEIAQNLHITRQHFTRLFLKHLCKTPTQFRKIVRFRKALKNYRETHNLTFLTYESLFYDQSHLIKDFQKLTGMPPKQFFKNNKPFNKGNINWYFV